MHTRISLLILILLAVAMATGQTRIDINSQTRETLALNRGGTGATTQQAAINALLPSQTSANGLCLKSDGTNVSWGTCGGGALNDLSDVTITTPSDGQIIKRVAGQWVNAAESNLDLELDATPIGSSQTLNVISGSGVTPTLGTSGGKLTAQFALDTAVALTRAQAQAGTDVNCIPASGSGSAYTCATSPTLTAYTTNGTPLRFRPDVNSSAGAVTLNVSSLGAVGIKQADGTTDPGAGALVAGRYYTLTYDGTNFRMPAAGGGGASTLNDLSDVTITSAAAGQFTRYNGSEWVNAFPIHRLVASGTDTVGTRTNVLETLASYSFTSGQLEVGDRLRIDWVFESEDTNSNGLADNYAYGVLIEATSIVFQSSTAPSRRMLTGYSEIVVGAEGWTGHVIRDQFGYGAANNSHVLTGAWTLNFQANAGGGSNDRVFLRRWRVTLIR